MKFKLFFLVAAAVATAAILINPKFWVVFLLMAVALPRLYERRN